MRGFPVLHCLLQGISGGQKRRVSLAIELVKDPIMIFADEPTSGLVSAHAPALDRLRARANTTRQKQGACQSAKKFLASCLQPISLASLSWL